jgi:ArsR family transcriptional regulator, arsenate/arsenite/antimonite-responsive transcriptional repressor
MDVDPVPECRYDLHVKTSTVLEQTDLTTRAEVLKAIADPTRLEILEMLSPKIRCNCHFQEQLDLAPNLLSYHLKVLREAGLIVGTKRGRWVDYALTEKAPDLISSALPEGLRP